MRALPSFHAPLKLVVAREREQLDAQRLAQREKVGGRAPELIARIQKAARDEALAEVRQING